jgi:pimeloyl-ACP methyl ester carboxylesterase
MSEVPGTGPVSVARDDMTNKGASNLATGVEPRIATTELPTGLTLPYVEQGDPSELPVVLLHGCSESWRSWETVLPFLPESMHVFAPTQRGHGDADKPADGYRFEDFAGDLTAFLDALGIGPAVLVGHSLGSYVPQRFAMDHPDRVLGLVLVGSATTWRGNAAIEALWRSAISSMTDPIDRNFVSEFQGSPRLSPEKHEVAVAESLKVSASVWRQAWQAIRETDYSAELGKIRAPTLIVWGDQDPLCPRGEQEALLEAVAGSRLVVYSGGGHNLHWEEPERFAADLVEFAASLDG